MRSKQAPKRVTAPDAIYGSRSLQKFINKIMVDGKKQLAGRLVYSSLDKIKSESKQDPLDTFEKALQNVLPKMEVRPRRVGGASYQVPVEVRGDRREALAMRWIIAAARARSNKEYHTFDQKLTAELLDAASGSGAAVKKREEMEKVAQANRAFAHFRW